MELHAYVGRQAIFDRKSQIVGYELLYRNSLENRAQFSDVDAASATTMLNAYLDLGLDELVGRLPAWVNLPASFLLGELPVLMPPKRTVIEVLETVRVTPALLDALVALKQRGFTIALDDFELRPETRPLLAHADIIKVDVLNVPPDEIQRRFALLRPHCATLVAEKISTPEEHAFLKELGFDLFQGFFLEKPVIARGERPPHNRIALVRLLGKLYDPRTNYRDIEGLLASELGLTIRLVRLAGSAALSRAPIGSVAQAVARLGIQQVASLVLLIVAAGFDDKPIEIVRRALVRARMCESLARLTGAPPDQLFTAGLLSLLDALLDQPLQTVFAQLPVTPLIRDVVMGEEVGEGARVLAAVRAQDRGDFEAVAQLGVSAPVIFAMWFDAIKWADGLVAGLATN